LRVFLLQQWYGLSDPGVEDAVYDSASMRYFARIELGHDRIPDESTIRRFRHLLDRNGLTDVILAEVAEALRTSGLRFKQGTVADAAIVAIPGSAVDGSRRGSGAQTGGGAGWNERG
jgi:IS5 family transposase